MCCYNILSSSSTIFLSTGQEYVMHAFLLLASERSERDTIMGVLIRAGAVRIYIYICMEVRMSY